MFGSRDKSLGSWFGSRGFASSDSSTEEADRYENTTRDFSSSYDEGTDESKGEHAELSERRRLRV